MSATILYGERRISGAAIADNAARGASVLAAHGIGQGDAVALLLRNDPVFVEAVRAANRLGAYTVPLNWHFAAPEIAHIIADSGAKLLIAHADLYAPLAGALGLSIPVIWVDTPREVVQAYDVVPMVPPAGAEVWAHAVESSTPFDGAAVRARGNMPYTSGTSGRPKGVRRIPVPVERADAARRLAMHVWGLRPGGRSIAPAPLYHSAPNSHGIIGSEVLDLLVLEPRFDAERLLATINAHRLTNAYMVPTMFTRLLALPEATRARYDVSSLEHVIITGAPCPPELRRRMIDWWGPVIHETYACSELGTVTFCTAREWLQRPGTVGRSAGEAVIRILDDDKRPLPAGEIGTIYARQPDFPDFDYINNADARAAAQAGDVATAGDIGLLDEDGYLFIADRRTDLILSGGANIYPAEIEAALMAMPGVADCAVFGVPDAEYGQRVVAHVQPEPDTDGVTPETVSAFLADRIARFKVPRLIVLDEALPRDANGKIFKRLLRDRYAA